MTRSKARGLSADHFPSLRPRNGPGSVPACFALADARPRDNWRNGPSGAFSSLSLIEPQSASNLNHLDQFGIGFELRVGRTKDRWLVNGLSDQEAIEGILVKHRQAHNTGSR